MAAVPAIGEKRDNKTSKEGVLADAGSMKVIDQILITSSVESLEGVPDFLNADYTFTQNDPEENDL